MKLWSEEKERAVYYNTTQIQAILSTSCGYFCVYFIKKVDTLDDFEEFVYDWCHRDPYNNEIKIEQFIKDLRK